EAFRSLGPADARGVERLSVPDARDMAVETPDDPADRTVARPGLLELAVAGGEDAADVAPRPGVCEREARHLRPRGDERLDVFLADLVAVGPDGQLLDLRDELVEVVPDQVDDGAAGRRFDPLPAARKLCGDPFRQVALRDVPEMDAPGFRARGRDGRVALQL